MKKTLILILAFMLLTVSLCSCEMGDIMGGSLSISYKIENGEAIVTKVPDNSTLPEIVIPDEYEGYPVTAIADFAAVNLENVTKITIGKNVKEISLWALENNKKVEAFEVDIDNPNFCDEDGVLFTKDMKTLLFYPLARGISEMTDSNGETVKGISYTVPEGVETIRTKAFYKCSELREISLPSTLVSIEEKAFFRCSISEITIPEKLEEIGKDAFSYCTGLKEILLPSSVASIGDYAFYNCTSLLNIEIQAKEADVSLGEKWYPTNNGLEIKELTIKWVE